MPESHDLSTSSSISFDRASKTYPGQAVPALDGLTLTIEAGDVCCIVGPSGGGKTTALLLVNRLVELSSGDIQVGGRSIRDIDPITLRRSIGYVIQQSGLFPHLTVGNNIGLIPELLGWDKTRIKNRTHELLELLGLTPVEKFAKRYPSQLSGGQQQRVGIARALAANPPVMLMDEPFGALDPITREHVQDEFLALQREIGKTTLLVTHDIDEAIKMGDRIAILKEGGTLAQYDTPAMILRSPADEFVEKFLGADRGLKRLSLVEVGALSNMMPSSAVESAELARYPRVLSSLSCRTTLAQVLAETASGAVVIDESGAEMGTVSLEQLAHAARLPVGVAA